MSGCRPGRTCCGYVKKCCFGLPVLCCLYFVGPHTPDSVMTSVPMTSAWSRRPTLSDWTRARAVRSAHGTPGLHVPRCDPRASLLPLNLSLSPTNLPFFFCHLLIVSTVSASPHTSVYVKHSNIFIYSFLVQLVLLPRSEVFVVPHYKNCIFSHLLLVVCSFWFYVPTFHTSSTQCCQI